MNHPQHFSISAFQRFSLSALLSAATAFWKRHFFMPPQPIPAPTTMQYPPSNFRGRSRRRQSAHFLAAGRPAPTHAGGYFLALLFALCALLAPASALAQDATNSTAWVTTDQSDYPPGGTVLITGSGFTPGETVTNQVLHIPDTGDNNTSTAHDPWTVTADDFGNFVTTWLVPFDQDELNATLQLTATGQTSGLPAQTTFTDAGNAPSAPTAVAVTLNPANSPPTVTASISEGGGNPKPNITGAEFFIDATGANGAGTAMNPVDGLFDSSNENVTKALTSAQFTALAEGGHTVSVHGQDANSTWGAFTSTPFTKDTIAPTVVSINTAGANPTNGATVRFTVTFDGSVSGVDSSDFTVTTSGGVTGTSVGTVTPTGASQYTVAVNTGSGGGTIRLDLNSSGTGIADTAGNAITTGCTGGQTYTIDKTPPVLNSASGPASGTYAIGQNLDFTVNYNENMAVTGTPTIGLTIGSTARSATYNAAGSTATALLFRYTVAPGDSDTDGISVASTITVSGGNTIKDTAGNTAPINFPALDTTGVLVDGIAPTVTINQAAGQNDPVNTGPINFTAVFSKPVSDFATGDVSVGGTAGGGLNKIATVSGGPTTYNVSVTGMTTSGTVIATIAPGVAHDSVGNPNTASTSTDGTVTWDVSAPAAPGTPNMTIATDSGSSTSDNITSNTMPAFTGSAEVGSTVTIYSDGSLVGTGSAAGYTGTGGITNTTALTDGSHNITAKATDVAGNTSTASAPLVVTIDTQIPITASVTNPVDGAVYSIGTPPPLAALFGGRAADNSGGAGLALNSTTFTLQRLSDGQYWTGNGTVWQIASNGLATTHTSTTGNALVPWHPVSLPASWAPDAYRVQATATDKAGNTFTGIAVNFTYTGPNNPTAIDTKSSNQNPLNSLTSVNATVPAGSTVFVTVVMDPSPDTLTVTVKDSTNNTYSQDANVSNGTTGGVNGTGVRTLVFSKGYTATFTGTITVSLPTGVTKNIAATFFSFPDLVSNPTDQSHTAAAKSAAPDSGIATPTAPDELLIGALGVEDKTTVTPGAGSGFSTLNSSGTGGNSPHSLTMQPEYKAVHAFPIPAYAANGSIGTPTNWAAAIVTYKLKVPSVTSIVRADPDNTSAATVHFTVTFSESVIGLDITNFTLTTTGVSGASVTGVTGNDGLYTVAVDTGTCNGQIRLNLVDNNSVQDVDNTPLGGSGTTGAQDGSFLTGEVYTIKRAITVTAATDSKTYDGTTSSAATPTITLGTVGCGDTATLTETYDTKDQGSNKTLTPAIVIKNGNVDVTANYAITLASVSTGTIAAKALSVTAPTIASRVYDATTTAGAVTVGTLSGFVSGETVTATATAAAFTSANVGSYPGDVVTYTLHNGTGGGLAANYSLPTGTATGTITAKGLTVTAPTIALKVYDGTTAAGAVTVGTLSGFVGTETVTATGTATAYSSKNVAS